MNIFARFSSRSSKAAERSAQEIELLHNSPLVDPVWYRQTYPDLHNTPIDVARHYLEYGAAEGRNPSPLFDTKFYVEQNPDVTASGMNPLVHFVLHGAKQGRQTRPPPVSPPKENVQALLFSAQRSVSECNNPLSLSVILVTYNMSRELPRTVQTLGASYQLKMDASDYEVVVVDNGSECSYDERALTSLCPNISFHRFSSSSPSPANALNFGISIARGEVICAFIDAARMATPGLLSNGLLACQISRRAVVGSLSFHLGYEAQNLSVNKGYNQTVEDDLLRTVGWQANGYQLYRIASFDPSSRFGLYSCPAETNSLFMHRGLWAEYGGFDSAFAGRGGGLVNLDLWRQLCDNENNLIIILLGEGTFHQFHGGAATNAKASPWDEFHKEYVELRGQDYVVPTRAPFLFGTMNDFVREFERRGFGGG